MAAKEAKARIKINRLLEDSDWRFFDDPNGKANIVLEPKVKLTRLLEDEFQRFLLDQPQEELAKHADAIVALKYFFKAYATDGRLREIIENGRLTELNVNPVFGTADFKAVPKEWRSRIPEYVKDYISPNQFM